MDVAAAAYERACAQAGVAVHPRFLSDFQRCSPTAGAGPLPWLHLGGSPPPPNGTSRPVGDADVVAVCLALRALARAGTVRPARLSFAGERAITCAGARTVAMFLQVDCGLRGIDFRGTQVGDDGAAALGAALGGSSVVELDLGECAVTDRGVRLLARGLCADPGPPKHLEVLQLDGNSIGDDGVVELIALLEGSLRPPALAALPVLPVTTPEALSLEMEAAFRVVCDRFRMDPTAARTRLARPAVAAPALHPSVGGGAVDGVVAAPQTSMAGGPLRRSMALPGQPPRREPPSTPHSPASLRSMALPRAAFTGGGAVVGDDGCDARSGCAVVQSAACAGGQWVLAANRPSSQEPFPGRSSSNGHLAAWMASTERELRELKWLFSASIARLDGQHAQLVGELGQIKGQLDGWERARCSTFPIGSGDGRVSGAGAEEEEANLQALEARFDTLERLVGSERSECSELWRLVEAATGGKVAGGRNAPDVPSADGDRTMVAS
mmetsp:Transcript_95615/g.270560  ORF Transcript_95615/g.270560 Transcript_95615/m.270560 type:complete len:497 (-) Transcript_95615:3-1493(-)